MVAYSFKSRFVQPILSGMKCQTIRAGRRRHARPGEELQLFTGLRTKSTRRIGTATCTRVSPIRIELNSSIITFEDVNRNAIWFLDKERELDRFARSDGFEDWPSMRAFWRTEHPGILDFDGFIIEWKAFTPDTGMREQSNKIAEHSAHPMSEP